jgi:hypothetical protein
MQARFDHVMTRIDGRLFLTHLHMTWDQHGAIVTIEHLLVPLAFVIAKPINVVMFPIVPIISCSKLGTNAGLIHLVTVLQLGFINRLPRIKEEHELLVRQLQPHLNSLHRPPLPIQSHINGFLRYPLLHHRQRSRG